MQTVRQDRSLRNLWKYVLGLIMLYSVGGGVLTFVPVPLTTRSTTNLIVMVIAGSAFAAIFGWIQGFLLYRWDYRWDSLLWRWTRWSILGGLVGGVLSHLFIEYLIITRGAPPLRLFGSQADLWIPVYLTAISVGQWFVLRQEVRGAWLWILANAIGAMASISFIATIIPTVIESSRFVLIFSSFIVIFGICLAFALPATISIGTLLYLFPKSKSKEKRKVEDMTESKRGRPMV